jgi:hypothetical protein
MTFTKKAIAGFALAGALAVPGIALAATSSADAGGWCVKSDNGCANASDSGAYHGAFGALGKDNNMSIPRVDQPGDVKGANGYQTGLNNSYNPGVAPGNRQGNLPTP